MSIPAIAADYGESSANAANAITYAAVSPYSHVIHRINGSYDAAPTGGTCTIAVGGTTMFKADITAAGPFEFVFDPPKKAAQNTAVVITLSAGGAGIVSHLNVTHTKEV